MNGRIAWHYAALIGAAALIAGCGPDTPERGAPPTREQPLPATARLSRNEAGQPPAAASRDTR